MNFSNRKDLFNEPPTKARRLVIQEEDLGKALSQLDVFLQTHNIPWPQLLKWEKAKKGLVITITGPEKILQRLKFASKKNDFFFYEDFDTELFSASFQIPENQDIRDWRETLQKKLTDAGLKATEIPSSGHISTLIEPIPER